MKNLLEENCITLSNHIKLFSKYHIAECMYEVSVLKKLSIVSLQYQLVVL